MNADQRKAPLFNAMVEFSNSTAGRFHVPGHGGRSVPPELEEIFGTKIFSVDLTELSGLDDLSSPGGVIARAQELAARAFGADRSFYLINGTTVGLQALITACCPPGSRVLLPRNIHRSVLGGLIISGAEPVFLNPVIVPGFSFCAGISRAAMGNALARHRDAAAVLLVHPTYYGVVGDTKNLAGQVHTYNLPLLADEAHGAHLHFHPGLPAGALTLGADASVQSIHKTGGSLTQTSVLHLKGDRVDWTRVAGALALLQTSSPSYPLLASLDCARRRLALNGKGLLEGQLEKALYLRQKLKTIKGIEVFGGEHLDGDGVYDYDPARVVISMRNRGGTGYQVASSLARCHRVFIEMADHRNLVLVVGLGISREDCDRFVRALNNVLEPDALAGSETTVPGLAPPAAVTRMTPREAWFAPSRVVNLEEAAGEVSAEWVGVYPPGIPALLPGEEITREMLDYLLTLRARGIHVQGAADPPLNFLRVVKC